MEHTDEVSAPLPKSAVSVTPGVCPHEKQAAYT